MDMEQKYLKPQEQQTERKRYTANLRALIAYMRTIDGAGFTMNAYRHPCGAPACALGHAADVFGENAAQLTRRHGWLDFEYRTFGVGVRQALFAGHLGAAIHTPQQWADHAERWLASQGL